MFNSVDSRAWTVKAQVNILSFPRHCSVNESGWLAASHGDTFLSGQSVFTHATPHHTTTLAWLTSHTWGCLWPGLAKKQPIPVQWPIVCCPPTALHSCVCPRIFMHAHELACTCVNSQHHLSVNNDKSDIVFVN